jgi:hypothetical protein
MDGSLVIQVHGPKPWESEALIKKIQNLIELGYGNEMCYYVRYSHESSIDNTVEHIPIKDVLVKIYEGRNFSSDSE